MKKQTPLGLVGLYLLMREKPGFHGQIVAEAPGPFVTVDVCSWNQQHKPVAVRVLNADDLKISDLYRTRAAWLLAIAEVDAADARAAAKTAR